MTIDKLADLIVGFGANVQPDQIVAVGCEPGKEYLVRAIANSAYRHGARFVDVSWFDPWIKQARVQYAREDTLDFIPSWYGERMLALGEQRCARIGLSGPVAPGLLADFDPARSGRDRLPALKESGVVVGERTTNWTIAPCPTDAWARQVFPELDRAQALTRLQAAILHVCRLDEDDPLAAWRARADELVAVAQKLTDQHFDSIRYRGPGTDLSIGLLPSCHWQAARFETVDGIVHMPNIPTEEVFTTPDPERVQGYVRASKPLVLIDGTVVTGLEVQFEKGRVTDLRADQGEAVMRTLIKSDDGAARLGEIALVDRAGRIGALDTVFYDTLLDENAASHIALGQGFPFVIDSASDQERINKSAIHIDFMIGSDAIEVTGLNANAERIPILRGGDWQL